MAEYQRGLFAMTCFNALSGDLQRRLVYHGNLPMGWVPTGRCHNPAEVEVTTQWDEMPGPRFYCLLCAIAYLIAMRRLHLEEGPPPKQFVYGQDSYGSWMREITDEAHTSD